MKLTRYFFISSFSILFIVGCSEEQKSKGTIKSQPPRTDQLINWELFNTDDLHNVSFPIWFNDDVIKKDSISSLELAIYRFQENQNTKLPKDTFPDEIWKISFDKEGWVNEVLIDEYSEAILIAEHEFEYESNPDSLGFKAPNVSTRYLFKENKSSFQGILNQVEDLKVFDRLVLSNKDSISVSYKNALSTINGRHVFLEDSSLWNVRFIDENFQADGRNIYYYGLPKHYIESFKLDNLVDKTLKQRRSYYENGVIEKQEFHDGGFYRSREFIYNLTGKCISLEDSIYSDAKEYIYAERSVLILNERQLPRSIYVYAKDDTLKENKKKKYEFSYSFNRN